MKRWFLTQMGGHCRIGATTEKALLLLFVSLISLNGCTSRKALSDDWRVWAGLYRRSRRRQSLTAGCTLYVCYLPKRGKFGVHLTPYRVDWHLSALIFIVKLWEWYCSQHWAFSCFCKPITYLQISSKLTLLLSDLNYFYISLKGFL